MRDLNVTEDDHGRRIDRVLRKAFPGVPPGAIAGAIRRGQVRINGKRCRNNSRVQSGDTLRVPPWDPGTHAGSAEDPRQGAPEARLEHRSITSGPWHVPILERTRDYLALNKPPGLTVHGKNSLEEIVLAVARREHWYRESLSFTPGPVHRLDRNTSGVQLFALSTTGAQELSRDLADRQVLKLYLALLEGVLPEPLEIRQSLVYDRDRRVARVSTDPDQALPARTRVTPLLVERSGRHTLAAAIPATGRTHQIRCHCSAAGFPLRGDRKYGGSGTAPYLLHNLVFALSRSGRFWNGPLPAEWSEKLAADYSGYTGLPGRIEELLQTTCTTDVSLGTIRV